MHHPGSPLVKNMSEGEWVSILIRVSWFWFILFFFLSFWSHSIWGCNAQCSKYVSNNGLFFFFKYFLCYYSLIALEKTPVGLKGGQKFFLNNMNSFFIFLRRFSWIFLLFPSRSCRGGVFISSDISARAIKRWTEGKNLYRKSSFWLTVPRGSPCFPQHWSSQGARPCMN